MKWQVRLGNKTRDSEEGNASGNNLINVTITLIDPSTLGHVWSVRGEPHGGKSLVGYSPWGRKESDTTEQLHFHSSPKGFSYVKEKCLF